MSSFLKNIFKGFQGFIIGFFVIIFIIFAYITYCFSNLFFFSSVLEKINHDESAVLITLHNESELRPTLGFLTGFILVTKDNQGNISMSFHDSYDISAPKKPIVAPDIIEKNFSADSRYEGWVFRDTNFDMQYSQNAKNAIAFLQYDERYKNLNISAVISIDMHAIEEIIDSVGGVEFEGEIINGENFFSALESKAKQFDRSSEQAWKNRKGSIKPLAIAIIKKCITSVGSWKNISNTINELFSEQHILFYSPQPEIQDIFVDNNISGNISLSPKNIPWGINIANIGGKKGDRYITKNIKSTFRIDKNGEITETIRLHFSHNGTRNLHSDRYFGYVRLVKPENTKLTHFTKSTNYINTPEMRTASFPQTSEFDFFFFIDPSSEETVELEFTYPKNTNAQIQKKQNFTLFTQPGIIEMPIEFVFQAFSDEQIKILECPKIHHAENISTCSFVAPHAPQQITIERLPDVTLPVFEDVIYKEDGKIIRIQFSEELQPIKKSNIVVLLDSENSPQNIEIESVMNKERAIEIVLKHPLSSQKRNFYRVLIDNFSDISGNEFEQYNTVIAYPKYK